MANKHRPKVQTVTLDGVSYNKATLSKYKTEAEFLESKDAKGHFEGENQQAKLKQLYALAQPKDEPKVMTMADSAPTVTKNAGKK